MDIHVSFKNTATKPVLKDYIEEKLKELTVLFATKPGKVRALINRKHGVFKVIAHFTGGDGFNFESSGNDRELQPAIESMLSRLRRKLRKKKEQVKNHKGHIKLVKNNVSGYFEKDPIDAEDLIKYEEARKRRFGS